MEGCFLCLSFGCWHLAYKSKFSLVCSPVLTGVLSPNLYSVIRVSIVYRHQVVFYFLRLIYCDVCDECVFGQGINVSSYMSLPQKDDSSSENDSEEDEEDTKVVPSVPYHTVRFILFYGSLAVWLKSTVSLTRKRMANKSYISNVCHVLFFS